MKIEYYGRSMCGARSGNEDAFTIDRTVWSHDTDDVSTGLALTDFATGWHLFAVADGMGGHAAGEVAARLALAWLGERCLDLGDPDAGELQDVLQGIHRDLLKQGRLDRQLRGMGCTLTGILLHQDGGFWFNVGDSRVYRLQSGGLCQLSTDHSLRMLPGMQDAPQNQLYSCLGGGVREITIDVQALDGGPAPGQGFLLTSDGYHEFMDTEVMEKLLSASLDAVALDKELRAATRRGSHDNITALALRILPGEET